VSTSLTLREQETKPWRAYEVYSEIGRDLYSYVQELLTSEFRKLLEAKYGSDFFAYLSQISAGGEEAARREVEWILREIGEFVHKELSHLGPIAHDIVFTMFGEIPTYVSTDLEIASSTPEGVYISVPGIVVG